MTYKGLKCRRKGPYLWEVEGIKEGYICTITAADVRELGRKIDVLLTPASDLKLLSIPRGMWEGATSPEGGPLEEICHIINQEEEVLTTVAFWKSDLDIEFGMMEGDVVPGSLDLCEERASLIAARCFWN